MTQNYGGIRWDSVNRIYEISGGDIKVANTIHFKNTLRSFNGNYNSLHNKPVLGIGYKYNNDTNVNTIGTGEFKFNNSTILSATQFSIHLSDINSNSNKTFLETFNESTNTNNKGILYLHEEDNYRNSVIFTIENMQSAPEEQLHRIFDIKRLIVKGNGLTDGLNYNITFSPTGNSGLNGSQGAAGSQGSRGNNGNNGNNGDNGSQGTTGSQGTAGTIGLQGIMGFQALGVHFGGPIYQMTTSFGFGEGPVFLQGDFAGYIANIGKSGGTGTYKKEEINRFQFNPYTYVGSHPIPIQIGIGPTYDEPESGWFRIFQVGDKIEFTSTSNSSDKVTYRALSRAEWKDSNYSDYIQLEVEYVNYSGSDSFIADNKYEITLHIPTDGATGAQGSTGTTGSQGTTGAQGERGIGNNGDNGDSTDFTNLNSILGGPAPKTDNIYTSKKSNYVGSVKTYTLSRSNVYAGQPVCINMDSAGPITCKPCDASTSSENILGIAVADTTIGDPVVVMTDGYVTARRTTTTATTREETVLMVDDSLTVLPPNRYVVFDGTEAINYTYKDMRGDSDYRGNDRGSDIFDFGVGKTGKITFTNWYFEEGRYDQYDRLSIYYSDDGEYFSPYNLPWLHQMRSSSSEEDGLSSDFIAGSSTRWDNPRNSGGNTFPANQSRGLELGWDGKLIMFEHRFVKFIFNADGSTHEFGWEFILQTEPEPPLGNLPGIIGQRLYLDTNGYDKVKDSGTISLGFIGAENSENNSIYMRVNLYS